MGTEAREGISFSWLGKKIVYINTFFKVPFPIKAINILKNEVRECVMFSVTPPAPRRLPGTLNGFSINIC